jgi:hypothetical protein
MFGHRCVTHMWGRRSVFATSGFDRDRILSLAQHLSDYAFLVWPPPTLDAVGLTYRRGTRRTIRRIDRRVRWNAVGSRGRWRDWDHSSRRAIAFCDPPPRFSHEVVRHSHHRRKQNDDRNPDPENRRRIVHVNSSSRCCGWVVRLAS